jgi:hypothetical protein
MYVYQLQRELPTVIIQFLNTRLTSIWNQTKPIDDKRQLKFHLLILILLFIFSNYYNSKDHGRIVYFLTCQAQMHASEALNVATTPFGPMPH